jgi:hypothetical protein
MLCIIQWEYSTSEIHVYMLDLYYPDGIADRYDLQIVLLSRFIELSIMCKSIILKVD